MAGLNFGVYQNKDFGDVCYNPQGGNNMKCPHCLVSFHSQEQCVSLGTDKEAYWQAGKEMCPACKKIIVKLKKYIEGEGIEEFLVYPKGVSRAPLSNDVPPKFAQDYNETCLVLNDSSKASAALIRRCLQNIIRDMASIKKSTLDAEITELLNSKVLPAHLATSVDAVRNIGNFAAHPTKSTNSGEVVEVEPGEAEWGLDVLEGLFDFYFLQPAEVQRKRDKLNKKLANAGKPPMK